MFRMRRYRLFLLVAVLTTATVWHLSRLNDWRVPSLNGFKNFGFNHDNTSPKVAPVPAYEPPSIPQPITPEQPKEQPHAPAPTAPAGAQPAATSALSWVQAAPSSTSASSSHPPESQPTVTGEEYMAQEPLIDEEFGQFGQGRYEAKSRPSSAPRAYWVSQQEHFPIPDGKLTKLPSGAAEPLPIIQHSFGQEAQLKKTDRIRKQNAIRESFKNAWFGYKRYAYGHDELKPVSNTSANPFNGWGATLVDSLDTLWIMGLSAEFDEAVEMVKKIDFRTSARKDIPVFETTIRYLGGLISAYDLSSPQYPVLLDKAVELADILLGAFDTPNRMLIPYYQWAPSYASQPHRAGAHIVLAEMGSLVLEFTRLAQITKENKYYDVVARVTDALEVWQTGTEMPGVWPVRLDASGCKKPDRINNQDASDLAVSDVEVSDISDLSVKGEIPTNQAGSKSPVKRELGFPELNEEPRITARQENVADSIVRREVEDEEKMRDIDCITQGLSYEPNAKTHVYSIGAMADSMYEYFPKTFALLGGRNVQYKTMYTKAMSTIRKDFLYRPMTKEEADILFIAKHEIKPKKSITNQKTTIYEGTHLGCFVGGMFALGSKIFDIPTDLQLAEKLTDACVWAYGSTPLGVMPEEFTMVPCDEMTVCTWNETKWHDWLDPNLKERIEAVEVYNKNQEILHQQTYPDDLREKPTTTETGAQPTAPSFVGDASARQKRETKLEGEEKAEVEKASITSPAPVFEDQEQDGIETRSIFIPKVALSHEKYVAARISEERLPPGYTKIMSPAYKLRPEAIESVFIMYRITGEERWREKGWKMFTAIDSATKTAAGNAAIHDVTSQLMELSDTMESFWLAETLKYFYLLFSEPDIISLDDYVFNTEAHPFKLPE